MLSKPQAVRKQLNLNQDGIAVIAVAGVRKTVTWCVCVSTAQPSHTASATGELFLDRVARFAAPEVALTSQCSRFTLRRLGSASDV